MGDEVATRVTLLTQEACSLCEHAKEVLARVGQDHRLEVEEVSLASERGQSMAAQGAVLFAPGIFLNGRPFGCGRLSERKLRRHLQQAGRL